MTRPRCCAGVGDIYLLASAKRQITGTRKETHHDLSSSQSKKACFGVSYIKTGTKSLTVKLSPANLWLSLKMAITMTMDCPHSSLQDERGVRCRR